MWINHNKIIISGPAIRIFKAIKLRLKFQRHVIGTQKVMAPLVGSMILLGQLIPWAAAETAPVT